MEGTSTNFQTYLSAQKREARRVTRSVRAGFGSCFLHGLYQQWAAEYILKKDAVLDVTGYFPEPRGVTELPSYDPLSNTLAPHNPTPQDREALLSFIDRVKHSCPQAQASLVGADNQEVVAPNNAANATLASSTSSSSSAAPSSQVPPTGGQEMANT